MEKIPKPILNINDAALMEFACPNAKFASKQGCMGPALGLEKLGAKLTIIESGKHAFPFRRRRAIRAWIISIIAALTVGASANAQLPENPIPSSGAALVMKKTLPDPLAAGWEGEKVCELIQENDDMRALRCTFPPGVGHERHYHAPHFGYILEGSKMRMTDADGTQIRDLNAGASWWSDGTDWHEVLNVGDTTGVYIIVEPKTKTGGTRK